MGLRDIVRGILYGPTGPVQMAPPVPRVVEAPVREGLPGGALGYDPDADLSAAGGGSSYYRRLSASNRDLTPLADSKARELAFYLYDANPLAKRILEIVRDYVVGEGVEVTAQDEEDDRREAIQAVLDRFWQDPLNKMDLKLGDKVLELGLFGEQCYPVAMNPKDGHVRLGYVDPAIIDRFVNEPGNAELARDVVLKGPSGGETTRLRVIHIDESSGPSHGRMVGVATDDAGNVLDLYEESPGVFKPYAGACFLFRINKVSTASRGRTDLLSIADWVDALDQILFGEVDRGLLMRSFLWDVTVTGGGPGEIEQKKSELATPPKPGSVRVHNEQEAWQAVTPDLKAQDVQTGADMLLGYAASGAGVPKTWLNGVMDVNRATATELSEPAFKRLTNRQRYVRHMILEMLTFVLDQAEMRSLIPRREGLRPAPWPIAVQMPELRAKDLKGAGETLESVARAMVALHEAHALDETTMQEVAAMLIGQLGIDVDLEAMRHRIEEERAAVEERMATAPYGLPTPNGHAAANGAVPGKADDDEEPVAVAPNGKARDQRR